MGAQVDDRLFVELRHADGNKTRWGGDEPDASGIPLGIKFSTSAPGGHRDAGCGLARDPRRTWPDLSLVDEFIIYGRTRPLGRNPFEGQTAKFPSELGDAPSISVSAVGNQVLLSDNEAFTALYVKLSAEQFADSSLDRKQLLAELGIPQGKIAYSGAGGMTWDLPVQQLSANDLAEVVASMPAGVKIAKVGYRGTRRGDWSKMESPKVFGGDTPGFPENESAALTLDGSPHVAAFATARRHAMLRAYVVGSSTPVAGVQQTIPQVATYGDHGLPLPDIEGGLPGVYGHDALAHMLRLGAPDLQFEVGGNGTIHPNQSFVVPELAFLERGTVKAAVEKLNAYFLNNWGVWDDKKFYWQPWDPDRLTWNVSVAGGAKWSPAGRQAETLLNGVIVSFTDSTGISRTAGPPGSGCDYEDAALQDSDPNNPYTRRGRRRWGTLSVGFPLAYGSTAVQVGAVFMAESKFPQRSGTLVLHPKEEGHIPELQHPTMGQLPVWSMRAGDYAQLSDWPEPEPFRVISTDYDHDSKTLTAQLDTGSARLSGILERVGVRMTGIA